jgi:hypothetical protein
VPGDSNVYESDREVWWVGGDPSREQLVTEVAAVVDDFADRIRTAYYVG